MSVQSEFPASKHLTPTRHKSIIAIKFMEVKHCNQHTACSNLSGEQQNNSCHSCDLCDSKGIYEQHNVAKHNFKLNMGISKGTELKSISNGFLQAGCRTGVARKGSVFDPCFTGLLVLSLAIFYNFLYMFQCTCLLVSIFACLFFSRQM